MILRRKPKRIAILGCGPAGLFAAHGFIESGCEVTIFSKKRRSDMFGAQYLHGPIPGLSTAPKTISYILRGTVEDYSNKVYGGRVLSAQVSPSYLSGMHEIWDIREAYYNAWDLYNELVIENEITGGMIQGLKKTWDLVVSSIPAPSLCLDKAGRHSWSGMQVWAIGDAPERGTLCPVEVPEFTVVYNGNPSPGWYRASNVFGYRTAEWPSFPKPPIANIAKVHKPLSTTCDCHSGKGFMRVGRYGTWTKGILSHEAYLAALEAV